MSNTNNLLVEVPYHKKGKVANFYDDYLEFKGKSIYYKDIAKVNVSVGRSTVHKYVFISVGRDFEGPITLQTTDGKKHNIGMRSMSVFGIPIYGGSPKKTPALYETLFDAVESVVVRNVAQRYIEDIKSGKECEISGLAVNNMQAVPIKKSRKEQIVITKDNYRDSLMTQNLGVEVFDKEGNIIWHSNRLSDDNNLVIPYVLDAIFG